jgi:hypothetical protein
MRKAFKISILTGIVALSLLLWLASFAIEMYWPLNPLIDTKFAASFDIAQFEQIKKGASIQDVSTILGQPIWKLGCGDCWEQESYVVNSVLKVPPDRKCDSPCNAEYQYWQFSDDDACSWWDFAWHYYAIDFHNGKVVAKHSNWHYD